MIAEIDAAAILAEATLAAEKAPTLVAATKEARALSWQPVDIAALVASGMKLPETALLERKDGLHLFYPARLHSLVGESESLKTWVALFAAYQEIKKANRVMMLDYEDNPVSVIGRMVNFGLTHDELATHFIYIKPDQAINDEAKELLRKIIEESPEHMPVTLVIIDGVTEVMSVEGLKVNDQEDVATFYKKIAKWLTSMGPAVVMIDHVTKSKDSRGKDAIGAQHKRAGIDGASYLVSGVDPFAPGKHGKSYLTVAKDKNGTVRAKVDGDRVGTFNIVSHPVTHDIEAWIDLPHMVSVAAKSASLKQKILDFVKTKPGCSKNEVYEHVGGDKTPVLSAIKELEESIHLKNTNPMKGRGHAVHLEWVRDYDAEVPGLEDAE